MPVDDQDKDPEIQDDTNAPETGQKADDKTAPDANQETTSTASRSIEDSTDSNFEATTTIGYNTFTTSWEICLSTARICTKDELLQELENAKTYDDYVRWSANY